MMLAEFFLSERTEVVDQNEGIDKGFGKSLDHERCKGS